MNNYWLHRISHEAVVSYPLLERGYLSIGWSAAAAEAQFVSAMKSSADGDKKWADFEAIMLNVYGELRRNRHSLWRFLHEFQVDDYVLVPLGYREFSLYKIVSGFMTADGLNINGLIIHEDGVPMTRTGGMLYFGKEKIDLGFFRKVEPIERATKLSRYDYADAALTSRMKIQNTNANISDLADNVRRVIEAASKGEKRSLYGAVIGEMKKNLLAALQDELNPDKLEMLVKWYLLQCGANAESSYFPAKNASDNIDGADADFVAVFEELKTIFYVQAKHHKNTTDEWAVEQINKYKEQKEDDVEYHHIPWVISTCEKFSEKAVNLAVKNKVRLINGLDFAELLLNAGLRNIDKAF